MLVETGLAKVTILHNEPEAELAITWLEKQPDVIEGDLVDPTRSASVFFFPMPILAKFEEMFVRKSHTTKETKAMPDPEELERLTRMQSTAPSAPDDAAQRKTHDLMAKIEAMEAALRAKSQPALAPIDRELSSRKLRCVPVDRITLGNFLKATPGKFYAHQGIPADAVLVCIDTSHAALHNLILLIYQSETFAPVPMGQQIPPLQVLSSLVSMEAAPQATTTSGTEPPDQVPIAG